MTKIRFAQSSPAVAALPGKLRKLSPTARNCALWALLFVDSGMTAQQALAAALSCAVATASDVEASDLAPVERNLCSELVYGYLRTELRIAFILSRVLPRPQSLPRPLLHVLGLAVYGLLFQDRVPDHAAVFSAVETAQALYGQGLARVANGTLRSVQRLADAPMHEDFYLPRGAESGCAEHMGLFYSLPLWIMGHWYKHYGRAAALQLARRSFERPWSAVRVNAQHSAAVALRAALLASGGEAVGQWGIAFAPGAQPSAACGKTLHALQCEGALSYQSAGSQLVLEELGLFGWDKAVWDVCAGFGGKTVALLERGIAVPLATDRSVQRLAGLPGQCARLGLACPSVALADAVKPPLEHWDGHLLVDAPCSGLGVLARRPDIRRRPPQEAIEHESLQQSILRSLASRMRSGCQLAYITCTLRPNENEKQIEYLVRESDGLQVLRQWQTPHDHPWLEGMFGALLQKI